MEDEILLIEGGGKPVKYICNYMKVCIGEKGKVIMKEAEVYKEVKDYAVILNAIKKKEEGQAN